MLSLWYLLPASGIRRRGSEKQEFCAVLAMACLCDGPSWFVQRVLASWLRGNDGLTMRGGTARLALAKWEVITFAMKECSDPSSNITILQLTSKSSTAGLPGFGRWDRLHK